MKSKMTRQELSQIHQRFFNSPAPISPLEEPKRFNKNLANRKPSKKLGIIIWNNGTFHGNIKQTFKL